MASKKNKYRKFKVYSFTGDYFSSHGEIQHTTIISALNEDDAERIFKGLHPTHNFGWVEPCRTNSKE